jgi:hypothetical protein
MALIGLGRNHSWLHQRTTTHQRQIQPYREALPKPCGWYNGLRITQPGVNASPRITSYRLPPISGRASSGALMPPALPAFGPAALRNALLPTS